MGVSHLMLLMVAGCSMAAPPARTMEIAIDELSSYLEADILPDKTNTKMALKDNHRLWPGGTLNYVIDFDKEVYRNVYNLFNAAVEELNKLNCVRLQEMAGVREEGVHGDGMMDREGVVDYVSIQVSAYMSSHLGRQGGVQTLNITTDAVPGTIMHELMHTLGFAHEHNRPDRDDYVTIFMDNVKPEAKPYFTKYTEMSDVVMENVMYDYQSIMHATTSRTEDISFDVTKPVIQRKDDPDGALGNRSYLTALDMERIKQVYSCDMCQTEADNTNTSGKMFRYPGDCGKYYQCDHRQSIPRPCPSGLHFNQDQLYCDYPSAAGCTCLAYNVQC